MFVNPLCPESCCIHNGQFATCQISAHNRHRSANSDMCPGPGVTHSWRPVSSLPYFCRWLLRSPSGRHRNTGHRLRQHWMFWWQTDDRPQASVRPLLGNVVVHPAQTKIGSYLSESKNSFYNVSPQMSTLVILIRNGDVSTNPGPLKVSTNPGPLKVSTNPGPLKVSTNPGPLKVSTNPCPLKVSTNPGPLKVSTNPGPLKVSTNPGPLKMSTNPGPLKVSTNPGPLKVSTNPGPWKWAQIQVPWKWAQIQVPWKWAQIQVPWKWAQIQVPWKWAQIQVPWKQTELPKNRCSRCGKGVAARSRAIRVTPASNGYTTDVLVFSAMNLMMSCASAEIIKLFCANDARLTPSRLPTTTSVTFLRLPRHPTRGLWIRRIQLLYTKRFTFYPS